MNDNVPHKPRQLYSPWPVVALALFAGTAIRMWSNKNHALAIFVGLVGIIIYWVWTKARTKMIQEELSLRELFKNW